MYDELFRPYRPTTLKIPEPKYRMRNNPFISFGAPAAVGGWVELDRTTLGSTSDNIDVTSLADKRYLMVLGSFLNTGAIRDTWRLNSVSTGTPYAARRSVNGAGDAINPSENQMFLTDHNSNLSAPSFAVNYFANLSTEEKICILQSVARDTLGAATPPNRCEGVGKHAQTSNPIDAVNIFNDQSGGFITGSEVVVLGWDPADIHTNNFWEELFSEQLVSDNQNFSTGTITAKKYLWLQFYQVGHTGNSTLTFNSDTSTSYSKRSSANGGADVTVTSASNLSNILTAGTADPASFSNVFIINNSANEKLLIFNTMSSNTAGAANAPFRSEGVAKWDETGAQITSIQVNDTGAGFDTGSFLKIWGSD